MSRSTQRVNAALAQAITASEAAAHKVREHALIDIDFVWTELRTVAASQHVTPEKMKALELMLAYAVGPAPSAPLQGVGDKKPELDLTKLTDGELHALRVLQEGARNRGDE